MDSMPHPIQPMTPGPRRFFKAVGVGVFLSFAVPPTGLSAADYPSQMINRIDSVRFGDSQGDVERMVERQAEPIDPRIGLPGDNVVELGGVRLVFDAGKLQQVIFDDSSGRDLDLTAYPEVWRNLSPIDGLGVSWGMTRAAFQRYMGAWEARAKKNGAREAEVAAGHLLGAGEYSVSTSIGATGNMTTIAFGPARATGNGNSNGDTCSISFVTSAEAAKSAQKEGTLKAIFVSCDAFNTHGRAANPDNQLPKSSSASGISAPSRDSRLVGSWKFSSGNGTVLFHTSFANGDFQRSIYENGKFKALAKGRWTADSRAFHIVLLKRTTYVSPGQWEDLNLHFDQPIVEMGTDSYVVYEADAKGDGLIKWTRIGGPQGFESDEIPTTMPAAETFSGQEPGQR
jgi:hypothetical protein